MTYSIHILMKLDEMKVFTHGRPRLLPWPTFLTPMLMRDLFASANFLVVIRYLFELWTLSAEIVALEMF